MEPLRRMGSGLAGLLPVLAALAIPARAIQPGSGAATPVVEFHFNRPGAPVPAYSIVFDAEGEGSYIAGAARPASSAEAQAAGSDQGPKALHAGPAVLARLLAARDSVGSRPCETRQKHIANTGEKVLSYRNERGSESAMASCTFNYSDVPALNDVVSAFLALAETVQAGDRLAQKHRFDRLGLDPEIEVLDTEVKAGRALEVGNIAPVLRSIAEDERVIERVRRKAARLLQDSGVLPAEAAGAAAPPPSER